MRHAAAFFLATAIVAAQAAHGGMLAPFLPFPAYALVVAGVLCALPTACLGAKREPWAWPACAVIALVAYTLWRCWNAPDVALGMTDAMLILACAAMWGGVSLAVTRNDVRFVFVAVCLAAACVQAGFAVLQLVRETEFTLPYWFSDYLKSVYEGRFPYRARGLFMNPNQFAWFMNAMALLTLSVGIWGRLRAGIRIVLIYLAAVFAVMTVLSASRGGMVSLVAGFGVFLILSLAAVCIAKGGRRILVLTAGVLLLLVCVGAAYAALSSSWLVQSRLDSLLNAEVRSAFAEEAIRLVQTQPLFGVGPGMYRYVARLYRTGMVADDPVYAHNDWLQFVAEYGIVGLAGLIVVAGSALLAGGRSFLALVKVAAEETGSVQSTSAGFTLGAVCSLTCFAVHSGVDFNMHVPANALLAAAVAGLLTGVRPVEFERGPSRLRPALWITALAGLAACTGLGVLLFQRAAGEFYALRADNDVVAVDMGKAREDADRGLHFLPDDAVLLALRGRAAFEYESWIQARQKGRKMSSEEAVGEPADESSDADDNTYEDASVILSPEESRRNFLEAERDYDRAARLQPNERNHFVWAGKAEDALGNAEAARKRFATAIRLDPAHAYPWAAYGDFLMDIDQPLQARRYYEVGAQLPDGDYSADQVRSIDEDIANEKEMEQEEKSE